MQATFVAAGFMDSHERAFWEVRRVYADADEMAADLAARTDRSILHELSDDELAELIAYVRKRVPASGPITDAARWTLWWATKPA